MAIRRANVLGVLSEMLDSRQKEYQTDRDFALKGVGIAISQEEKKKAAILAEKEYDLRSQAFGLQKEAFEIEKEDKEREREKEAMEGIFRHRKTLEEQQITMVDELGTKIKNSFHGMMVIAGKGAGEVAKEQMYTEERRLQLIENLRLYIPETELDNATLDAFSKGIMNVFMNSDLETGAYDEVSVEAVYNMINSFDLGDNKGLDRIGIDFYGIDPETRTNNKNAINVYYKTRKTIELIDKEMEEYNILGDTKIGKDLTSWLTLGKPYEEKDDSLASIFDTSASLVASVEDMNSLTLKDLPYGDKSLKIDTSDPDVFDFSNRNLLDENLVDKVEEEKLPTLIPGSIDSLMKYIGKEEFLNKDGAWEKNPNYWDRIESALGNRDINQNVKWFGYKEDWHKEPDGSLFNLNERPNKTYKKLRNNTLDMTQESIKSTTAKIQLQDKIDQRLTLDKNSDDPMMDYTKEERNRDKMTGILIDFQIKLLSKRLKENEQREESIANVMTGAGGFFSGAALRSSLRKLDMENALGHSSQLERRNK